MSLGEFFGSGGDSLARWGGRGAAAEAVEAYGAAHALGLRARDDFNALKRGVEERETALRIKLNAARAVRPMCFDNCFLFVLYGAPPLQGSSAMLTVYATQSGLTGWFLVSARAPAPPRCRARVPVRPRSPRRLSMP